MIDCENYPLFCNDLTYVINDIKKEKGVLNQDLGFNLKFYYIIDEETGNF